MTDVYPVLPGWTFSVFKEPQFKTKTQRSVSGREQRLSFQPIPLWLFKLKYDFLRDKNDTRQGVWGTTLDELRTIMGFFLKQQGSLNSFLFDDPTDNNVVRQGLGVSDGIATTVQLIRSMGGFNEPIIAPKLVTHVYRNGTDFADWTVNYGTGIVTFNSPPPANQAISADFSYYFLVRFADDVESFEYFSYQLWSLQEVKLQSVFL